MDVVSTQVTANHIGAIKILASEGRFNTIVNTQPEHKATGWLIDSFLSGQVSPDLSLPSSYVAWLTSHSKRK